MSVHLSWDKSRLQFDRIHAALTSTYWSPNVRRDIVERAAANSLTLGVYEQETGEQIAYARVITDQATFAYMSDVIVFEGHRGKGIGKAICEAVLAHPDVQTVRTFALGTRDAHSLYARYGFGPVPADKRMERSNPPSVWQELGPVS